MYRYACIVIALCFELVVLVSRDSDDGTGVIDVRLPLRLWDTVALHDQVNHCD